jgi:hypothetical protein
MHHRLVPVVVTCVAALSQACISNTARGIAANGAPLRVRTDSSSGTYQAQQVVGQDTYYDRDGNAAGSVERTRMVTKRWSKNDVSFYQGADQIDEQDYYHLAKDPGGVDEIKEARAQMSRDLTIGFPVAIAGLLGSSLLATGRFGESKGLRVYAATGATVVGLVGAYFAYRGLETYRKKPLLGVGRAMQHASEVEHCYRGTCHTEAGGSPQVAEAPAAAPTSLSMRKAPRWSGTWSGVGRAVTSTKDGRSMTKSSQMEFQIEEGEPGSLIVTLEPRDTASCKLTAHVRGDRAELDAGQTCRRRQPDGEIAMTVRDGSTIAFSDDQVTLEMGVDLELVATGRKKGPRSARLSSAMSVTATRR